MAGGNKADWLAGAVPVCGAASGSQDPVPAVWAFWNREDVPGLVESNRAACFRNGFLFSEYKQSGHDAWTRAYATEALYTWVAERRRGKGGADELHRRTPVPDAISGARFCLTVRTA